VASQYELPPGVAISRDQRLVAARIHRAGSTLIEVPARWVLNKDTAQNTVLQQYLDPEDGGLPAGLPHWAAQPDLVLLALQLALRSWPDEELGRHWRDTWLVTAEKWLNGTSHWSMTEFAWLEGSRVREHSIGHGQQLDHELQQVLPPLVHHHPQFFGTGARGDFSPMRVRGLVDVVAAHALVPVKTGRPVLLPLPQLRLEHDGNTRVDVDVASGAIVLRALRLLHEGEEVTLEGKAHDHAAAMVRQGDPGVDPHGCAALAASAPGPTAVPLALNLDEHDPLLAAKEVLLAKASLSAAGETFTLREGRAPPLHLLPFARLMALQSHELPLLSGDGGLPMEPLAPANEDNAFRHIAARIEARLAAYPSSVEEDEYELGKGGSPASHTRRAAAVAVGLLEKRLLLSMLATLNDELHVYLHANTPMAPASGSASTVSGKGGLGGKDQAGQSQGVAAQEGPSRRRRRRYPSSGSAATPRQRVEMRVSFAPIGVELVRDPPSAGGAVHGECQQLRVRSVEANGTAARAGVTAGMVLEHVDRVCAHRLRALQVQRQLLDTSPAQPLLVQFAADSALTRCQCVHEHDPSTPGSKSSSKSSDLSGQAQTVRGSG
jgi:hypothetical protein